MVRAISLDRKVLIFRYFAAYDKIYLLNQVKKGKGRKHLTDVMKKSDKLIRLWLISGAFFVLTMVVIGGITRLTGSGLSIVEWDLVYGILPPLNEQQWNIAFDKYKTSPEYQKINYNMDLSGFKQIFFWEYLHRLIGRFTGFLFIIPFAIFYVKGYFSKTILKKVLLIFTLGLSQGVMGWLMVKSGLSDIPHVSHYRLAAHLVLAFFIIASIVWAINSLQSNKNKKGQLSPIALLLSGLLLLQIIYGAFVAGLKAGYFYNTYPDMGGFFIPPGIFDKTPALINLLENAVTVQFVHRWIPLFIVGLLLYMKFGTKEFKKSYKITETTNYLFFTIVVQIALGINTLLSGVNIISGVLHQIMAAVIFMLSVQLIYQTREVNEKQEEKQTILEPV
ncbi:COX15/CtaA family protein [Cytophagaceae bacterium ABcell3]|nr:COX15/CtaA family protein [Cytophagaceae bacterium ABcell3]